MFTVNIRDMKELLLCLLLHGRFLFLVQTSGYWRVAHFANSSVGWRHQTWRTGCLWRRWAPDTGRSSVNLIQIWRAMFVFVRLPVWRRLGSAHPVRPAKGYLRATRLVRIIPQFIARIRHEEGARYFYLPSRFEVWLRREQQTLDIFDMIG